MRASDVDEEKWKPFGFAPINMFVLGAADTVPQSDQNMTNDLTKTRMALSILHSIASATSDEECRGATGKSKVYTALGTECEGPKKTPKVLISCD